MNDPAARQAIMDANELEGTDLTDAEIEDLIEFLESLTDNSSSGLLLGAPPIVPSGLPVAD
jgi:hypothetical protein